MVKSLGLTVAALLAALSAGATPPKAEQPAAKAVLVAKGKTYLVHVLPPRTVPTEGGRYSSTGRGSDLLYTNLKTGEIKVLIATGSWSIPTRLPSRAFNLLVGVGVDGERLYTLLWTSGRQRDLPPANESTKGGTYRLQVFWLADGSRIEGRYLRKGLPAEAPRQTTEPGPLTVKANTVSCYGLALTFKGKELVKTEQK
jgi:hypothetical protein